MRPVIVIPSRLASQRLPGKALADIAGCPMIVHVTLQALKARFGPQRVPIPVLVASGDSGILDAVSHLEGVTAIRTSPDLPSGSDRVQAALAQYDPDGIYDHVINLQGDLPFIDPVLVEHVLQPLIGTQFDIGTLIAPLTGKEERNAPSVVKVACAFPPCAADQGAAMAAMSPLPKTVARALYFSRLPVPWGEGVYWQHIGIYAWRRDVLARFVRLRPSPLEQREKLEQLRALEAGMTIGCCAVAQAPLGVDVPADLERARRHIL